MDKMFASVDKTIRLIQLEQPQHLHIQHFVAILSEDDVLTSILTLKSSISHPNYLNTAALTNQPLELKVKKRTSPFRVYVATRSSLIKRHLVRASKAVLIEKKLQDGWSTKLLSTDTKPWSLQYNWTLWSRPK